MAGTRIRRAPERLDIMHPASGVQSQLSMRSIKQRGAAPAQAKSGKAKGTGKAGAAFVGVHVDRAADPESDGESVTRGADGVETSRTDSGAETPKAAEAAPAPEGDTEEDDDGQTSSDSEEERAASEEEEEEGADEPEEMSDYEKQRLIRIKDNQATMVALGIEEATTQVAKAGGSEAAARRKIAQTAGPPPDPEPCAPKP